MRIPASVDPGRVAIDPGLDTVTVALPLSDLPRRPRVEVYTPEDALTGLTLDGSPPPQFTPILLTFYDTFAARLPAEALRSWDGAHSGPRGERHGLKHLLDAAQATRTPLVLLDLKAPESLSALDAMGVLPRIRQLEQAGWLLLPDQPAPEGGTLFGFPASPFSWSGTPLGGSLESQFQFAWIKDATHLYRPVLSKTTTLPAATASQATQPTPDGPPLEARRAMLEVALNRDAGDLLILGGSLRDSTWGSPGMVGASLAWFASRPYVRALSAEDLLDFPTRPARAASLPRSEPTLDNRALQAGSALEFAAAWAGKPPSTIAYCQEASFPACVLANDSILAVFDPQGARLVYLFVLAQGGIHQIVGPSWQVAPGIDLYPGAFADADDPFRAYTAVVDQDMLTFTAQDGARIKTFRLTGAGIEARYQTQEPALTRIPLLVEPDARFTPGWATAYTLETTPDGILWGLENDKMVKIRTDGALEFRAFNESLDFLAGPEDPNFSYPPGHYIPFPMAVAEVEMRADSFLRLECNP